MVAECTSCHNASAMTREVIGMALYECLNQQCCAHYLPITLQENYFCVDCLWRVAQEFAKDIPQEYKSQDTGTLLGIFLNLTPLFGWG